MIASRLKSIAVFGDGVVGVSAALAFLRALPGARVTIVSTPADPAALADTLPGGLPGSLHFHRLVGIGEQELIEAGAASHRIGTRFEGWREDGRTWHHCFEAARPQIKASPFHQQWVRAQAKGAAKSYEDYSAAVALARAGKFAYAPEGQQSLLDSVGYAVRLDPVVYRQHLLRQVQRSKAIFLEGKVGGVELLPDGRVAHVLLDGGERIQADLFIDCAGPAAPLLSRVSSEYEDWAELLPCDQIAVGEEAPAASPVDVASATDWGYSGYTPLPSGSRRISVSSSSADDGAHAALRDFVTIRPGMRKAAWVGNVVAFGDSAVALDPLESTNLFLAHSAITRAVKLLPDADFQPLVLKEYNRQTVAECERVRDFVAAHYIASSRRSGSFWKSIDKWKVSDGLAHTLEQFRARGRLPKYEEETLDDQSWFSVLLGLGFHPSRPDLAAFRVDESASAAVLEQLATASAEIPAHLPPYPDYLRSLQRRQAVDAAQ